MTIQCFACQDLPTFQNDAAYLAHMQGVHGTTSPGEAMIKTKAAQQNVPASIPIQSLPSPEFMEVANAIDNPPVEEPPLHVPSTPYLTGKTPEEIQATEISVPSKVTPTPKALMLKYKYEGCHDCGSEVKTIMVTVDNQLVANAYCLTCDEVVKQISVESIVDTEIAKKESLTRVVKGFYGTGDELLLHGNSNSTKNIRVSKKVRAVPQAK